ncbi:MAG: SIS domain-containing protein [Pirellulales bacterium]|nr:SIS domain-containing protein [Pirellulales bacterium]
MPRAHRSFGRYAAQAVSVLRHVDETQAAALTRAILEAYHAGRMIFVCGNGGSGSNASHICEDFGKSSLDRQEFDDDSVKRLRILSLTDNTPYILAWANDAGFERVFVEQLKNLASPGDLLIALSGSGNSPNVLRAVDWANRHELATWGVTGFDGGALGRLAQGRLHVPSSDMGTVEALHLLLFHWILGEVHAQLHPEADIPQKAPGSEKSAPVRADAPALLIH